MRTCCFVTVGCKVNQYETQVIREQFLKAGFQEVSPRQKADYCLINTCTVTQHSDRDCRNLIRRLRSFNPHAKIIVVGCSVEANPQALKDLGCVDFLVHSDNKFNIVKLVTDEDFNLPASICYFAGHDRAFVKVQDGCNNFCSFCIVPYVRGKSRSRLKEEVVNEVRTLVTNGYLEIVLCGVCLGDYGKDRNESLVSLLSDLVNIKDDFRIRLSSIEPKDISEELINFIASNEKICHHLHIPFQSGDDQILKSMHRPYNFRSLVRLTRRIYKKIPGLGISADIIVGFPGETDKNFNHTIQLLKEARPIRTHIFTYSPRPATRAAKFDNLLPVKLIKKRYQRLHEISEQLSFRARKRFMNKSLRVLVESETGRDGFACGYTDNYIRVKFKDVSLSKPCLILAKINKANLDSTWAISLT